MTWSVSFLWFLKKKYPCLVIKGYKAKPIEILMTFWAWAHWKSQERTWSCHRASTVGKKAIYFCAISMFLLFCVQGTRSTGLLYVCANMPNSVSSVMKFFRRGAIKSNIFGQKFTNFKKITVSFECNDGFHLQLLNFLFVY